MLLFASTLAVALQIALDPAGACGIHVVGYRFVGLPGQTLVYAGETFEIPAGGWLELTADPQRTAYGSEGVSISLDASSPLDAFGFRTVALPSPTGASEP